MKCSTCEINYDDKLEKCPRCVDEELLVSRPMKLTEVMLVNSMGLTKLTPTGFSWEMLIFGSLVPLFRSDFKWFAINTILPFATGGISLLVMPFLYNKIYIKGLVTKGYIPADEISAQKIASMGILVPGFNQQYTPSKL